MNYLKSDEMISDGEMLVLYDEQDSSVVVARIRKKEEGICFVLELDATSELPYDKGQLESFIQRMIVKPLKVSKMRHKAFPDVFDELVPDSDEHFDNIDRTFGPFRILKKQFRGNTED